MHCPAGHAGTSHYDVDWTCCFVTGQDCRPDVLLRRWSCCPDVIVQGTFGALCRIVHTD